MAEVGRAASRAAARAARPATNPLARMISASKRLAVSSPEIPQRDSKDKYKARLF
jgi:hypothetical protein